MAFDRLLAELIRSTVGGFVDVGGVVVATARSFLGTPYRMGGTTTAGIDCSGLVMKSYAAVGIVLPHKAAKIRRLGREVSVGELRAGDVPYVITGSPIEHVGIYDGNGNVIHATGYFGKTVIEPLENWRKRRWLSGARRIL